MGECGELGFVSIFRETYHQGASGSTEALTYAVEVVIILTSILIDQIDYY